MGSHSLLQEIFPTQGQKPGLPHCRQILCCLSHQRSLLRSITHERGTPRSPFQLALPSLHLNVNIVQNGHDNEIKASLLYVQSQLTVNTLSKSINLSLHVRKMRFPKFLSSHGSHACRAGKPNPAHKSLIVNTVTHIHAFIPSQIGTQQPTLIFLPGESPWTEEPGRL